MILGIESSCDESALALFEPDKGLLGEWVHSQIARHQPYGGVVPDLASREHLQNFPHLLREVLEQLEGRRPEQLAVTCGPGLAGCLALGLSMAKALAAAWQVPVVGVNHLRGHAFSPFIALHEENPADFEAAFEALLPHLGLIVSGGNSVLFRLDEQRQLSILAETVDDAAGEALDKGAKLLGMPYPGGPLIEKTATEGDPKRFDFPRAFADSGTPRFSFSGLKTSLRYKLEGMDDAALERDLPDICASYQAAVVDALLIKSRQALRKTGPYRSLGLSGGVANNRSLRAAFERLGERHDLPVHIAQPRHTGDNAAMIAFAAWLDAAHTVKPESGRPLTFDPGMALAPSAL